MTPSTIPELVARAASLSPLGQYLTMGEGEHSGSACAQFHGIEIGSAYEPIFDVSMHGIAQTLNASPDSADRFGDELGFQAVTRRLDGAAFDLFDTIVNDPELVTLDRFARVLHAINFFGAGRHGLLFLRVHERLLKSVKYDHGRHFSSILISFGLSPARVVIELPGAAVAHRTCGGVF
jgi:hypothetical protein